MKQLLTLLILFFFFGITSNAQKTKPEELKNHCEELAIEKRPRVTVSKFKITNAKINGQLGEELPTMLMNALNETKCFQVLESISNLEELQEEIQLGENGVTTKETAPQAGLMNGAQLIVSGEITEYTSDYVQTLGVGTHTAHVGFILKIVDPQTRTVVWSKSIDKKIVKPSVKVLNVDIATFASKAIEDAVEQGILDAVELIIEQKPLFENYNPVIHDPEPTKLNEIKREIIISNVDFVTLSKIEKSLKTIQPDMMTKKSFKDNVGTIELYFDGSMDDVAAALLDESMEVALEITAFEDLKIETKTIQKTEVDKK